MREEGKNTEPRADPDRLDLDLLRARSWAEKKLRNGQLHFWKNLSSVCSYQNKSNSTDG